MLLPVNLTGSSYCYTMRPIALTIVLLLLFAGCHSFRADEPLPKEKVKVLVLKEIDAMIVSIDSLELSVSENLDNLSRYQFGQARLTYKKIESIIEFYFPGAAKAINGPAIDKADEHDDKVNYATGFQVVEEFIFPHSDTAQTAEAIAQVRILKSCAIRIRSLMTGTQLSDANIFQATRLEILRVLSLGISGFDSPVAFLSLRESNAALAGIGEILSLYNTNHNQDPLWLEFERAKSYLEQHGDNFDAFDRAEFITAYLNPLSRMISNYQKKVNIADNRWSDAVNLDKDHFFYENSYNVEFFAKPKSASNIDSLVQLGKILFFDPVLSGNNKRACASCHQPAKGFADGKAKSLAFNLKGSIQRNAPTLINAGYQKSQFWDQRVHFLEDQVLDVVGNPAEMHHSLDLSTGLLNASQEYRALFAGSFGEGSNITAPMIGSALSAYIMSLQSFNSPFDKYMRGDSTALTREEIIGFNLFMGKAKCGTCHFTPLFNGSTPPMYAETESEVLGVPEDSDTVNARLDSDLGKYHTYPRELFKNAFKTPTVRNAGLTAPYMHNGVYDSLSQVIDFYNRGGGQGIGVEIANQTLPSDKLNLSKSEQKSIIAFINALSDTVNLTGVPARLPLLKNEELNRRRIGGEY